MIKSVGEIEILEKSFLLYSIYSFGGSAGSPIFWKTNHADASSAPSVIGMHKTSIHNRLKYGVLLNQVEN